MSRVLIRTTCLLVATTLSGCFSTDWLPEPAKESVRPTLAQLDIAPVRITKSRPAPLTLEQLRSGYTDLIGAIDDPAVIQQLSYRMADIEILLAEQAQEAGQPQSQGYYAKAIDEYEALLSDFPGQSTNAEVMYQLSRAYDLQGESHKSIAMLSVFVQKFPQHQHIAEAWFRLGEQKFAASDYSGAINAYSQVVDKHTTSEFFSISAYMLGWSHFKLEQYHGAMLAYTAMLDATLQQKQKTPLVSTVSSVIDVDPQDLPLGQKKLVVDTLRIMALLFSYAGDAEGLAQFYQDIGPRRYEHLVYDELAQQHLNNDRYRDSAEVLKSFALLYPDHPKSIPFFVRHIDAYILGDFPSLVFPAKQAFVEIYGIHGYLNAIDETGGLTGGSENQAYSYLHSYLTELARYEHSVAQQFGVALTGIALTATRLESDDVDETKRDELVLQQKIAYANAARWYREFLDTFPDDPETEEMHFYLAEALYDADQFEQAAIEFLAFAKAYPLHLESANAAYSAILATQKMPNDEAGVLRQQLMTVQQYFAEHFASDPRSVAVAGQLMHTHFEQDAFHAAMQWGEWLLASPQTENDGKLRASANLVVAHSLYALEDFVKAEASYKTLLAMNTADANGVNKRALEQRIAASIYQQANLAVEQNNISFAIEHLERIISDVPTAALRSSAQYDMATYLLKEGKWQPAIAALIDFGQRFSQDPLAKDVPEKLLYAYEQTEQWSLAADLLKADWEAQPATEPGRIALLTAAEYYLKAEDTERSLKSYRTYAHQYPQPFQQAMEARFTMSEFYRKSGEKWKRDYWLKKIIKADSEAGNSRTNRSRYLGAMAQMEFAVDAERQFNALSLQQPLVKSLKKKQQALSLSVNALDKVLAYGVADFTTVANFKLAHLYQQLAEDLMASERPESLSELELEQYELLLEEQVYPFEEKAIAIHMTNSQRSWQGLYDKWVKASFSALESLSPGRFAKVEQFEEVDLEELN